MCAPSLPVQSLALSTAETTAAADRTVLASASTSVQQQQQLSRVALQEYETRTHAHACTCMCRALTAAPHSLVAPQQSARSCRWMRGKFPLFHSFCRRDFAKCASISEREREGAGPLSLSHIHRQRHCSPSDDPFRSSLSLAPILSSSAGISAHNRAV